MSTTEEVSNWLKEKKLKEINSLIEDIGFAITQFPGDKKLIDKLNEVLLVRAELLGEEYPQKNTTY